MKETHRKTFGWEKVHIFVSSTFKDMHADRDYLVKRVFPELQDWCEQRKLRLVDVDLRWGVTEQDAAYNKNALKVCLNRIDECRPFFLCFLGQRRGWVPKEDEVSPATFESFPDLKSLMGAASMTEIEILHALFNPMHQSLPRDASKPVEYYEPAKYAFFYLRDPSYIDQLPADPPMVRETYTNEAVEDGRERAEYDREVKKWRENIASCSRLSHSYEARWDPNAVTPEIMLPLQCASLVPANIERWQKQWQRAGVTAASLNLEDDPVEASKAKEFNTRLSAGRLSDFKCEGARLSKIIVDELQRAIVERYPDHLEIGREDELEKEIDQQEEFLFVGSDGFIEREGDFTELDDYAETESNKVFVLTAAGGMGKSTLLANWIEHYRRRIDGRADHSVHFRFIGQSEGTTTVYSLLRLLLGEIKEVEHKLEEEIPLDPTKLRNDWFALLEAIGKRGKTIIVIDALNELESGLSDVSWLPHQLPNNIKLIVSFKRGDVSAEELYERFSEHGEVRLSEVKPFENLDDRRRLVRAYLSQYLKELDKQHLETLVSLRGAENPLYLKVVLSELRVFGAYANLAEKVHSDFGQTPVSAFARVLDRLENDPAYSPIDPKQAAPLLFGLLAHARHGLSVDELTSLFIQALELEGTEELREAAADTVNLFLRQVRSFLARREGRYGFFFESFKIAAQCRYVGEPSQDAPMTRPAPQWHRLLADFFFAAANSFPHEPWRGASRRSLNELSYHLLQAHRFKQVESLYADLAYLEAMCVVQGSRAPNVSEHHGIIDLLSNLQDGVRFLKASTEELPPNLIRYLGALDYLLVDRSRLLQMFPKNISQEIANYIDTVFDPESASLLGGMAAKRVASGLLVKKKILVASQLPGHTAAVTKLAAAPSGKHFLSGGIDGSVGYWQMDRERPLWIIGAHKARVTWVAFSKNGRRAISTGEDGSVFIWDINLAMGHQLSVQISRFGEWPYASFCAFLDEGTILLGLQGRLRRIEVSTGTDIWQNDEIFMGLGRYEESQVDFSPGCNCLAAGDKYGTTKVADGATGEIIKTFQSPGAIKDVALSSDCNLLVTADAQGRLIAFNLATQKQIDSVHTNPFWVLCKSYNGPLFYAIEKRGRFLRIVIEGRIHLQTRQPSGMDLDGSHPTSILALPDGETVLIGFKSGAIALFKFDTGIVSRHWKPGGSLCLGAIFPQGNAAIAIEGTRMGGKPPVGDKILFVLPSGEIERVKQSHHAHFLSGVAVLGPDLAVTVDKAGTAVVWHGRRVLRTHRLPTTDFTTCAGWREVSIGAAGTRDDTVVLMGKGDSVREHQLPSNDLRGRSGISALAVAGKPMRVFAVYFSGEVRFLGNETWSSNPDTLMGSAAALDSQYRLAASGTISGEVQVWRCADGAILESLALHQGAVTALAFSDDGATLYTAGSDRFVYGIDTSTGKVMLGTVLPATPIALLTEPGHWLTTLDSSGNIYRFSCKPSGEPQVERLLSRLWKFMRRWLV